MNQLFAFIFGGIFAFGLILSGMSNPEKVLSFLDILGDWDASLAFVMIGAICITIIPMQKMTRKSSPKTIGGEPVDLPKATRIDRKLILGSGIFGIGWGLAGICPAPAITLIGLGHYQSLYFIAAMITGMWLYQKFAGEH